MSPRPSSVSMSSSSSDRHKSPSRTSQSHSARDLFQSRILEGLGMGRPDLSPYLSNPVGWVNSVLGETLWSKQREIMESVRDNRHTAVQSCHGIGKSFVSARIVCWWLSSHHPGEAFVVTSATSWSQVRVVLWREIGRAHAKGQLSGRLNQAEWIDVMPSGLEETVAIGRKPADHDPDGFQGIHAPYVLVVFDEAGSMPDALWDAADSLVSNDNSRFLCIGNPTDPTARFFSVCKPGSPWHVIKVGYSDTPNFTDECLTLPQSTLDQLIGPKWVEEKKIEWGETNPRYCSRVLGLFPQSNEDGLIPHGWIESALTSDITPAPDDPIELGVDVGGGGDKTVLALRRGPCVKIIERNQDPNTMSNLGRIIQAIIAHGVHSAKVDYIGIGRGIVDQAALQKDDPALPVAVRLACACIVGVNVGQVAADREGFVNLKAEGFWNLRQRFQDGRVRIESDPSGYHERAAAQLADIRYRPTSSGRVQIESKEEVKRRGQHSPDDADAIMLAFLSPPVDDPGPSLITAGTRRPGITLSSNRRPSPLVGAGTPKKARR